MTFLMLKIWRLKGFFCILGTPPKLLHSHPITRFRISYESNLGPSPKKFSFRIVRRLATDGISILTRTVHRLVVPFLFIANSRSLRAVGFWIPWGKDLNGLSLKILTLAFIDHLAIAFRNPNGVAVPFAAVAVFTLIIGTVYYQLGLSSESGLQNRAGLFYFICLELAYFNGNAVDIFIRDRARFRYWKWKNDINFLFF